MAPGSCLNLVCCPAYGPAGLFQWSHYVELGIRKLRDVQHRGEYSPVQRPTDGLGEDANCLFVGEQRYLFCTELQPGEPQPDKVQH